MPFPILRGAGLHRFKPVRRGDYFAEVLDAALRRFRYYESRPEGTKLGKELYRGFVEGLYTNWVMGRQGGLHGPGVMKDISTGKWASHHYKCREADDSVLGTNWFAVRDFAIAVNTNGNPRPRVPLPSRDRSLADQCRGRS